MIIKILENPSSVSEKELQADILQLPAWRREKVLSFKFLIDRVLCAKAYLMLKQGLKEAYGIDCNPVFDHIGHDKPVLRDYPDIHFNLSHCRNGVLCVIDSRPVGCDIESVEDSLDPNVCRFCYDEEEISAIKSSDNPCVEFTRLWTMKEAYLKLTGEGINDNLPLLFAGDTLSKVEFDTKVCVDAGYVRTICVYGDR